MIIKNQIKNTVGFFDPTKLTYDKDFYITENSLIKSEVKYFRFNKVYENNTYLFLMVGKRHAVSLPKKLFSQVQIDFIKNKIIEVNEGTTLK